ncbi:hypothetical protein Droror1_Dr00006098 [Drosera rotundifolia]
MSLEAQSNHLRSEMCTTKTGRRPDQLQSHEQNTSCAGVCGHRAVHWLAICRGNIWKLVRKEQERPLVDTEEDDIGADEEERVVGFIEAWKTPGVATYAFSLFFAKLVTYTKCLVFDHNFLDWIQFCSRFEGVLDA